MVGVGLVAALDADDGLVGAVLAGDKLKVAGLDGVLRAVERVDGVGAELGAGADMVMMRLMTMRAMTWVEAPSVVTL